ncbi:DUF3828 domain-containing protein [Methylovirgula sp. 4M-Z18]|uniref:DUF3828 domain-containing protein n=1 Tax=Methylovirgula sp. 4M-Z18 TaxID=2293567 RepID=UPI000E2F5F4C|nr:DUF3828 domain-containing protein [Methylovirgula sp. 4M-Z18]RFB78851.1 DUF3828 domain-containing protein [Methylovirgula sp. 4M-Z18]
MRGISFTLLAVFMASTAYAASTPVSTIEAIYKSHIGKNAKPISGTDEKIYSARRRKQLHKSLAGCEEICAPVQDFDYFVNGQDYEIKNVAVKQVSGDEKNAIVVANFLNFDKPEEVTYMLVNESGKWLIDDVKDVTEGETYDLDKLFKRE